ncbi:MAG: hypothetical protein AB1761_00800 [Pseudomonadota bacterium]
MLYRTQQRNGEHGSNHVQRQAHARRQIDVIVPEADGRNQTTADEQRRQQRGRHRAAPPQRERARDKSQHDRHAAAARNGVRVRAALVGHVQQSSHPIPTQERCSGPSGDENRHDEPMLE